MKYSNWAEIVEVTKTWGRELYKSDTSTTFGETLGNFNPEKPNPENQTVATQETIKSQISIIQKTL